MSTEYRYVFRLGRNRRERERIALGVPAVQGYPKAADPAEREQPMGGA